MQLNWKALFGYKALAVILKGTEDWPNSVTIAVNNKTPIDFHGSRIRQMLNAFKNSTLHISISLGPARETTSEQFSKCLEGFPPVS